MCYTNATRRLVSLGQSQPGLKGSPRATGAKLAPEQ